MGVGLAKQDSKMLKAATEQLATIAGQQPSVRRARKSIAAFKLREGMPVGVAVTLRAERGYEFLDRLISIAIPRIRDFRGLNPRSFDGRGNYSLGVKEQIIFPEIDYDAIDQVRGLDITITTSAASDIEAYALLAAFGMPFSPQGRPKGYDPAADEAAARAHEEAEAASAVAAAKAEVDAAEAAQAKAEAAEAKAAKTAAKAAAKAQPEAAEPEAAEPEVVAEAEEAVAEEAAAEAAVVEEAEQAVEAAEPEAAAEPESEAEVVVEAEEAVAEEAAAEAAVVEEAEQAVEAAEAEAAGEPEPEPATEPQATAGAEDENNAPGDGDAQTTEKESTD